MRADGRLFDQLRNIKITPNVSEYAEGSAIVEFGRTKVLCTATYESKAPSWLLGTGAGWITAEYGMLPRSTHTRIRRDKSMTGGRTQEISRLIGRSLRAAVDLKQLGEKQIIIDCDVLNADGGTRTASVTGGFVALALALKKLHAVSEIKTLPLINYVSAISVGLHEGQILLDLNYDEDSAIGTDMNFVMTDKGQFVEVQGTAEHVPFTRDQLFKMMDVAEKGCRELFIHQASVMGEIYKIAGA
ncbi:ribonuclease PH [Bdellovibrio bacteriovorus]|uniref:Ribonuclease PH n=1 Tax=Bdellovibrio bacteriovorus (strain ATCC 15356 / DSM 50701 / NCIMB 9529 / HD100) TaxID=264462 RepID=RNPH_BDEBA|nr:ribonuclease PH [Bdellovibrio bacteriovorus]Q6MJR9.1 RecName: Full=Ribonuclease PH; Short=RNase PH; AltName: Full=tRNA nucleotidyltransferase [Bdellovibrio bacteriovorus HD100]AHZ85201.1 ribonuclease PH [Bdellovibrio bacteriovorus]BEV69093.1 Ribonuclease PH [Bdellovibrio bacteriovorus]CAE80491.1 ribonuclease PH [Bdellovibrio bacteriovorus HD100]